MQNRSIYIPGIALGNTLTMYEFVVYGFSSTYISRNFFPYESSLVGLLLTFTVFAMAGLVRPFGACLFGYLGDHIGRKKMLIVSIGLIGLSTGFIGLIPTYNSIGGLAVFLLCMCRILQGLALSGEEVGSALYLMEVAPVKKEGLYGSVVTSTIHVGVIFAICIVLLCNSLLAHYSWSWRIPFIAAIPISVISLLLRIKQSESFEFEYIKKNKLISRFSAIKIIKNNFIKIIFGILSLALMSMLINFYVIFLPSYLKDILTLSSIKIELLVIPFFVFSVIGALFVGYISDKVGYSLPILISCILTIPSFVIIMRSLATQSIFQCSLAMLIVSILVSLLSGSVFAYFKSIFPTNIRYISVGIIYNISMSIFGGSAPGMAVLIMHNDHQTLYMLIYVGILVFLTSIGVIFLNKTRILPLRDASPGAL